MNDTSVISSTDPVVDNSQQVDPVVQQSAPVEPVQQTPVQAPVADPVDDMVAQGSAIQDLFAQNDLQSSTDQPSQKSPLDILEEILAREEQDSKSGPPVGAAVPHGPTPEELEQQRLQQQAAEQAMIEEHRQKMMAETQSTEQKQRDQIRQQQIDANKVNNPYEIHQLQHKKM